MPCFFYGRGDRIRTCGILVPNQARYQLRYTSVFKMAWVGFNNSRRDAETLACPDTGGAHRVGANRTDTETVACPDTGGSRRVGADRRDTETLACPDAGGSRRVGADRRDTETLACHDTGGARRVCANLILQPTYYTAPRRGASSAA